MYKQAVLQAYKSYRPETGGIISVIHDIVNGLQKEFGHTVLCAGNTRIFDTKGLPSREYAGGINIIRCHSFATALSLPLSPSLIPRFWSLAKNTDLVAYHYPTPWFDIAIASYFPANTRLIIHWHADITAKKQLLFLRALAPFIRRTLKRADCIIVSNPNMIKHSAFLAGFAHKCCVIPFGIDVKQWQHVDNADKALISQYRKQFGSFFFACGRLVSYKGYDVLIRALQHTTLRVVIAGAGRLEKKLRDSAREHGLGKQLVFMGSVHRTQLKCLYKACYAVVFPSVSEAEAFGLTQLEAMSCEKAIINTNLRSGVPWVARNGNEAITVPPGDYIALREALIRLSSQPQLAAALGQAGKKRCLQLFTRNAFLDACRQQYTAVLEKR